MNTIIQLFNKIIRTLEHLDTTSALVLVCCVVAIGAICDARFRLQPSLERYQTPSSGS